MADFIEALLPAVATDSQDNQDVDESSQVDDEGVDPDAPAEEGDTDVPEGDEPSDDSAEASTDDKTKGDGRTLPAALKELIKLHPEQSKLLKDLWFTNSSYNKFGKTADVQKMKEAIDSFGSIDDMLATKEKLDLVGGSQGLEELQATNQAWDAIDQQWQAGSADFVQTLAKSNPESYAKIAPNYLSTLGNEHPELYNHIMAQVVTNTLIQNGSYNDLMLMKQALASGNSELAQQALDRVEQNLQALQTLSQKAPAPRQVDPRAKQFEQEKQTFESQRQEMFTKDLNQANNEWIKPTVQKELTGYLKGRKISDAAFGRIYEAICDEVRDLLGQNKSFMSRRESMMGRQDKDGLIKLWKGETSKLWPNAVRKVAREFDLAPGNGVKKPVVGSNGQAAAKPNAANGKADSGFERVTKFPDHKDVDKSRTSDDMIWNNQFVLKSGKKIQVVS